MMAADPGLVTNIKDALTNPIVAHGGSVQMTGESKVELNGVPAYLMQFTVTGTQTPKPILVRNYQIAANGKLYLISLRTIDATLDGPDGGDCQFPPLRQPPDLPKPKVSRLWIKITLAVVAGVILIAGIGGLIYWQRQRQLYE